MGSALDELAELAETMDDEPAPDDLDERVARGEL